MEDYKKKYERALSRASYIKDSNTIATPQEVAELLFPELKESKDERIRKAIINHLLELSKSRVNLMTKATYENWIAWLEKQGEQKPTWSEEDMEKINKTIWLIEHYASHGHVKELREEAVSWLKFLKDRVGCEADCITKQEWSEEDENLILGACLLSKLAIMMDFLQHMSIDKHLIGSNPSKKE